MKKTFSNDYATFWIEEGILFFLYHSAVVLDLNAAEKVLTDRIRFQEEKSYPIYCDLRGLKDTDKAARDYLARDGTILTKAIALHVEPLVSKTITDFYIGISKPDVPTEVFTEKYDALKFLKKYTVK